MTEEKIRVQDLVKEEKTRKIFAKVFDQSTVETIHSLATKGLFDVVEFVISTGKEAHVFRAKDINNNYRAIKVYKIETSDFKHMDKYLFGDERFKSIRRNKRNIVFTWTRKEYKNLEEARKAGVRVPLALAFLNNVLVMEFIGENGEASKTLKETKIKEIKEPKKLYETMVEYLARLFFKANLVHADFSEYNILMKGQEAVLIDCGQAVLKSHPQAQEFFERDLKNTANYAKKLGLEKSPEDVKEDVKKWKEKLQS